MKNYILVALLVALILASSAYGEEIKHKPIRVYKAKHAITLKVWCFEGTKWLWAGLYDAPPVQIMETKSVSYLEPPKPIKCK